MLLGNVQEAICKKRYAAAPQLLSFSAPQRCAGSNMQEAICSSSSASHFLSFSASQECVVSDMQEAIYSSSSASQLLCLSGMCRKQYARSDMQQLLSFSASQLPSLLASQFLSPPAPQPSNLSTSQLLSLPASHSMFQYLPVFSIALLHKLHIDSCTMRAAQHVACSIIC